MYELENISWSWMFLLIALIVTLFVIDRLWKNKIQKLFFLKSKNVNVSFLRLIKLGSCGE